MKFKRKNIQHHNFGGYITDIWGVYHGHLGGISRTFGGYITDIYPHETPYFMRLSENLNLIKTKIKTYLNRFCGG